MSEPIEDFVPENLSAQQGQRYRPLEGASRRPRGGIHPLLASLIIGAVFVGAFWLGGRAAEGVVGVIGLCALIFLSVWLYFLPSIIAGKKDHLNLAAIFALNLLLGWTFLGWVVALVWSLTNSRTERR